MKIFQSLMLASFSSSCYLPRLCSEIIFATKPLATWLPIVFLLSHHGLPLATYCHMPDVAQGQPSLWLPFALPWATYCLVAIGHLLWAVPIKIVQVFKSLMFSSFSFTFYLPRLHSEISSSTKPLATWLPIVCYCLTMGYLWLPIVIHQM